MPKGNLLVNLHVVQDFMLVFEMIERYESKTLAEKFYKIVKRIILEGGDNIFPRVEATKYLPPDHKDVIDKLVEYLIKSLKDQPDLFPKLMDINRVHEINRVWKDPRFTNMLSENSCVVLSCLSSERLVGKPETFEVLKPYIENRKFLGYFVTEEIQNTSFTTFLMCVSDYWEMIQKVPEFIKAVESRMDGFEVKSLMSQVAERIEDYDGLDISRIRAALKIANPKKAKSIEPLLSYIEVYQE